MARYRLSGPARADIAAILKTGAKRHGPQGRVRYRALLTAALRRIAADPEGNATNDRPEVAAGVRSFHIRYSRTESREAPVANPVHVIFYWVVEPGVVEIVRVLHERMAEPACWRVICPGDVRCAVWQPSPSGGTAPPARPWG